MKSCEAVQGRKVNFTFRIEQKLSHVEISTMTRDMERRKVIDGNIIDFSTGLKEQSGTPSVITLGSHM